MFLEGNNQESDHDRIEDLRLILEREQQRSISLAEAQEVGESLLAFFELLADDSYECQES